MKSFKIQITEKLIKTVEVMADSVEDAQTTVKSKYKNDEIALDYSNFRDVTFESVDFEIEYKTLVDDLIEYVCKHEFVESNQNHTDIFLKINRLKELNTH